jgi:NAD(P)-dependent dehydrogenase (short-subunit alcohol dehydrogenase family)
MDTGLKGKTVLITGASRNVGRVMAVAFAREGANLALCTSAKMEGLEETARLARAAGADVLTQQCDVTDAAQVEAFASAARKKFGGVDVAVNNAVYRAEAKGKGFLDLPFDIWQRNIEVNLTGPYHICRNVIPDMQKKGWGRIINFSGIAPFLGHGAHKAMVKIGIVGFTRGLATEFAANGITANSIGPGAIATERETHLPEKKLHAAQPMRRLGKPEEIADLTVYLASEQAGFITGQCYLANGGWYYL